MGSLPTKVFPSHPFLSVLTDVSMPPVLPSPPCASCLDHKGQLLIGVLVLTKPQPPGPRTHPQTASSTCQFIAMKSHTVPMGQRVEVLPPTHRGHTPPPLPHFILTPLSSGPLRCQVTQEVSQEENSDTFCILKGSSPPNSTTPSSRLPHPPQSDTRPPLLWPTPTSPALNAKPCPLPVTFPCVEPSPCSVRYLSFL